MISCKKSILILLKKTSQFIKFALVGVVNTIIGLSVYYFLVFFNVHYLIANVMGFLISVLNAYFMNKKFVFKSENKKSSSILRVYCSYGMTALLSTILLYIMVNKIGISDKIAPLINLFITTPLNFLLNKYWAFK